MQSNRPQTGSIVVNGGLLHNYDDRGQQDVTIRVQKLYKHYGKTIALRGIDLEVRRGELFGLIGPDGAGKTTAFHILGGVMEATTGDAQILGLPARDARNYSGYLTQQFSLYPDLSVDENIHYSAGLRLVPADRVEVLRTKYLKLMQLERFGDRLAGQLSGGMKQKLALCCALIAEPQVLLLDEPTTGVDTIARREFWDILAGLTAQGITVVVATPDLVEAERCDRVALIHEGQIQLVGTPAALKADLHLSRLTILTPDLVNVERTLMPLIDPNGQIANVSTFGDRLEVLVKDAQQGESLVRDLLIQYPIDRIQSEAPTLENVFIALLRHKGSVPKSTPFPRSRQFASPSNDLTLYDDLTILENLQFYSGIYGIPPRQQREKIRWVLAICGLEGQEHLLTRQLPGGWKQRVAFGASVMHEPEILFLDEPTSGVDVLARQQFWQLINDFARNGTAILVTTHYMNEAEQCNRMCFMVAGRKVAEGSASQIKSKQPGQLFELQVGQLQTSYDLLRGDLEPWRVSIFGDRLHVVLDRPDTELPWVKSLMQQADLPIFDTQPLPFSLEDAFIGEVQRAGGAPL